MSDLAELLERVRAATGPDRSIDVAIAIAFPPEGEKRRELSDASTRCGQYWYSHKYEEGSRSALEFTASIDAALALTERMLPGWSWKIVGEPGAVYPHCAVVRNAATLSDVAEAFVASHRTPSLAILSALLAALIAQEPQP